jgi:hypothetical protein
VSGSLLGRNTQAPPKLYLHLHVNLKLYRRRRGKGKGFHGSHRRRKEELKGRWWLYWRMSHSGGFSVVCRNDALAGLAGRSSAGPAATHFPSVLAVVGAPAVLSPAGAQRRDRNTTASCITTCSSTNPRILIDAQYILPPSWNTASLVPLCRRHYPTAPFRLRQSAWRQFSSASPLPAHDLGISINDHHGAS